MTTSKDVLAALLLAMDIVSTDDGTATDETVAPLFAEELANRLETSLPSLGSIIGQVALAAARRPEVSVILSDLTDRLPPYDASPIDPDMREDVDVLLLTVKEPELLAVLAAFDLKEGDYVHTNSASPFRYWRWASEGIEYLLCNLGKAGNVTATLRCFDLDRMFRPRIAVLVGMAAGIRKRGVREGDVVVAEHVYNYEYARWGEDGLEQAAKPYTPSADIDVDHLKSEAVLEPWRASIKGEFGRLRRTATLKAMPSLSEMRAAEFNLKVEPIMSGGWIIQNKNLPAFARDVQLRVTATEMEGAGFAAACDHLGWKWLVVRGIADMGEPTREKQWQLLATFAAAKYIQGFLARHALDRSNRRSPGKG